MADRLKELEVFVRVAETQSFTEAAARLGLSKAGVSNVVQQLEARVGARLLYRTTRRVHPTQDGLAFLERCRGLLADADELETMFQTTGEALSGRIRVDMPSRFARLQVIPGLREFLEQHPGLEVELGSTDRAVDLVREGYDCVLRMGQLAESGLVVRRVGEVTLINCASPEYLRRHGTPKRLEDLRRHHVVHWVPVLGQKPAGWEYLDGGECKELPMKGNVTVNSAESYTAACLAGLGLIQVPRMSLEPELKSGQLVEVLPKLRAQPMPISILYPHRRYLSRRVRRFIEWLEKRIRV